MQMRFRSGTIMVPDITCRLEEVAAADALYGTNVANFFALLPSDHPWRKKLFDAEKLNADLRPVLAQLSELSDEMRMLLGFLYRVHDTGRVCEALLKLKLQVPLQRDYSEASNHAEMSVWVLEEWGVLDCFSAESRSVIEYAILNHFGGTVPPLPVNPTPVQSLQWFMACLLRDVDKYGTFRDKTTPYLWNEKEQARQIAQFSFLQGEQSTIDPLDFLVSFGRFEVPARNRICSYESYMLYFLAWIFDVNLRAVVQAIIECGAIHELLTYFRQQLPSEQYDRIEIAVKMYLLKTWNIDLRV